MVQLAVECVRGKIFSWDARGGNCLWIQSRHSYHRQGSNIFDSVCTSLYIQIRALQKASEPSDIFFVQNSEHYDDHDEHPSQSEKGYDKLLIRAENTSPFQCLTLIKKDATPKKTNQMEYANVLGSLRAGCKQSGPTPMCWWCIPPCVRKRVGISQWKMSLR